MTSDQESSGPIGEPHRDNEAELLEYARQLETVSGRLRAYGVYALTSLVASVAFLAINTISEYEIAPYGSNFADLIAILSVLNLFVLYFFVFRFEELNRSGNSLYNEISDELQWDVRGESSNISRKRKPPISVRYVLRRYVDSSVIPVFSFKSGPAIIAILGTMIAVASILVTFVLPQRF